MLKAYKYRIYPNKQQEELIQKTFGCCKFVYNRTFTYRKDKYKKDKESMNNEFQRKLDESYQHIKPYLASQEILKDMCSYCERYCGGDHNYEECLNMPCFKCFLGYSYLAWETSWE